MENTDKRLSKDVNYSQEYTVTPLVDIYEEKEGFTLVADMPGVSKDNLELTIDNNELTILGKTNDSNNTGMREYSEYTHSNFKRTFIVSDEIDTKNISATMENGILHLVLPKNEKSKPRKIEIKSA